MPKTAIEKFIEWVSRHWFMIVGISTILVSLGSVLASVNQNKKDIEELQSLGLPVYVDKQKAVIDALNRQYDINAKIFEKLNVIDSRTQVIQNDINYLKTTNQQNQQKR